MKVTKLVKHYCVLMLLYAISIGVLVFFLAWLAKPIFKHIEKHGLESVIERIWKGEKSEEPPKKLEQ